MFIIKKEITEILPFSPVWGMTGNSQGKRYFFDGSGDF